MYLPTLTDHELLAYAYQVADPLTTSDVESQLIARFERLLDEQHDNEGVRALTEEYDLTADDMRAVIESHPASLKDQAALLSLLNDQDIHEPDQLKELLGLAAKFRALASDAGDLFTRPSGPVTPHQE